MLLKANKLIVVLGQNDAAKLQTLPLWAQFCLDLWNPELRGVDI